MTNKPTLPERPREDWGRFEVSEEATKPRRYNDKVRLPALASETWNLDSGRQQVLIALYSEVCSGWRTLTDVRFKLIALLPIVSVTVMITVLSKAASANPLKSLQVAGIATLGFVITLALWLYDRRNTQLYDDFVGRAREIEAELGIHTGAFRGRPNPKLTSHDTAINLIYAFSAAAWIFTALGA